MRMASLAWGLTSSPFANRAKKRPISRGVMVPSFSLQLSLRRLRCSLVWVQPMLRINALMVSNPR